MDKKLIEDLKEKLEKQRDSLQQELESFATKDKNLKHNWDARYPNRENGNMEEEADEAQEYDNLLALEHNLELRLKNAKQALEKIGGDKYGVCEKCGKDIDEKRLQVCPEAKFCMNCNK